MSQKVHSFLLQMLVATHKTFCHITLTEVTAFLINGDKDRDGWRSLGGTVRNFRVP